MITKIESQNIKKVLPVLNDKLKKGKITSLEVHDTKGYFILALMPNRNTFLELFGADFFLSSSDSFPYLHFKMRYKKIGFIRIKED